MEKTTKPLKKEIDWTHSTFFYNASEDGYWVYRSSNRAMRNQGVKSIEKTRYSKQNISTNW